MIAADLIPGTVYDPPAASAHTDIFVVHKSLQAIGFCEDQPYSLASWFVSAAAILGRFRRKITGGSPWQMVSGRMHN